MGGGRLLVAASWALSQKWQRFLGEGVVYPHPDMNADESGNADDDEKIGVWDYFARFIHTFRGIIFECFDGSEFTVVQYFEEGMFRCVNDKWILRLVLYRYSLFVL